MVTKETAHWRETLSDEAYRVCWEKGTEAPFSGALLHNRATGEYHCVCCGNSLFDSNHKFDAGCGWPAFDMFLPEAVLQIRDNDGSRTEIICASCKAHLGHVFVGEKMTDKDIRHCVNSISIRFIPKDNQMPEVRHE